MIRNTIDFAQGTLRPLADSDAQPIAKACVDPEIARWTQVPVPYSLADAREFIRSRAGEDHVWVMDVDGLAGVIGLRNTMATMPGPKTEVGYWVAPWARGRGVATAALIAVRDECQRAGYQRIDWEALSGNEASVRVAARAGFRIEGVRRQGLVQRGRLVDSVIGGWTRQPVVAELVAGQWQVQPLDPEALPADLRPAGSSAVAVWVARSAVGGNDNGYILALQSLAGVHVVGQDAPEAAVDAAQRYLRAQGWEVTDEPVPPGWV